MLMDSLEIWYSGLVYIGERTTGTEFGENQKFKMATPDSFSMNIQL
jgi:hypothetical protein